jgi:hypothetical protein
MVQHRLVALAAAVVLVVAGCGPTPTPSPVPSPTPAVTPSPSPSPSPTATPLPSPVTGSIPVAGGTLAVPGGAGVVVPAGALTAPATGTITAAAATGGPTDAWPADPVGPAWTIDLGSATLAKPVTLTLAYDPAVLPAGTDPSELLLAYQDPASGAWTPVATTVDPVAHTVSASVSHLSVWDLFTINWDYWLGFIAKAASGNLNDLLGAFATLTTKCADKSGVFVVDNSKTNGLIKGCVQKIANGTATIGVTNMRLISFGLSGGALGSTSPILDGGDTVTFTAGGTKLAQPLVAGASLSPMVLGYQLTDLTLRLLPGSDVFTKAGSYAKVLKFIVDKLDQTWTGTQILAKLKANPTDVAGAAEEAFKLMTGQSFLAVFVKAAIAAGHLYDIPYLSALTTERMSRLMLAANLVVLDTTVLSWDVQYFLAGYGEVKVTWTVPPAAPTGLSRTDGNETSTCGPGDPPGTTCIPITLGWTRPRGEVKGYKLYEWAALETVWAGPGTEPPCDWVSLAQTVSLSPSATTYRVLEYGSPGFAGFTISAFNGAGSSPRVLFPGSSFPGASACIR